MTFAEEIDRWTGKITSRETEAAYQRHIFERNRRHNFIAISIALPLYALYFLLDRIMLEDVQWATAVRITILTICGALLASMKIPAIARHHEFVTVLIMLLLGSLVSLIIWHEPTLNSDYYVGLIQGGVFISFLLRISFFKLIGTLSFNMIFFASAVAGKDQANDAVLQIFVLLTMFSLCSFGFYLFERHRRTEFLQARTIEKQNEQLTEMLADARSDNERKLAALNTLIHFVKTPIHQIVGFTDLIVAALKEMQTPSAEAQMEHAAFVKKASAELAANVARLLAYYQLDEQIKDVEPEKVPLASMLDDFKDGLPSEIKCVIEERPRAIFNYMAPIKAAMSCLESACMTSMSGASTLNITATSRPDGVDIAFSDDGPEMTPERFADLAKPLTKIRNYLTADGMAMPMALRTVARAAEICGGKLTFHRADGRNVLTLSLADLGEPGAAAKDQRSDAA